MKQRIVTAIVAMTIFIPFVLYGKWPFTLLIYFLATIGLMELLRMNRQFKEMGLFPSILATFFTWVLLLPESDSILSNFWYSKTEVVILFSMILLAYTVLSKNKFTFDHASFILFTTIYISMGFYFLNQTRAEGLNYILFVLFLIWATDTGAYFSGRAFGKKKLWPVISPNKTIEGAIGGIVSAVIVGIVFHLIHPFQFSMSTVVVVTILISIVGQIGDLVASAYKRHYEVKDSGNLLPGHGGILDRLDSLLFVVPFLYLINFIS